MATTTGNKRSRDRLSERDDNSETLERLGDCVLRLQGLLRELRDLLRVLQEEQALRAQTPADEPVVPPVEQEAAPGAEVPVAFPEVHPGDRGASAHRDGTAISGLRVAYGGGASMLAGQPASPAAARAALIAADMAMAGYTREEIIARLVREGGEEAVRAGEQALG